MPESTHKEKHTCVAYFTGGSEHATGQQQKTVDETF